MQKHELKKFVKHKLSVKYSINDIHLSKINFDMIFDNGYEGYHNTLTEMLVEEIAEWLQIRRAVDSLFRSGK